MLAVISNWAGDRMLAHVLGDPLWLALHESDPGPTGIVATELAGGGYGRRRISFPASPSGKAVASTTRQRFTGLTTGQVVNYLAVWDAATGGNMIFVIDVSAGGGISVTDTGEFICEAGDVALQI